MRTPRFLLVLFALFFSVAPAQAETSLRIAIAFLPPAGGSPFNAVTMPARVALMPIFDALTRLTPDGGIEPALAERWENPEPLRWVFDLKPGLVFSNGEPIDARAVVTAIEYLQTPRGLADSISREVVDIDSVRAIDTHRVEFVLKAPNPILPRTLSGIFLPAPAAWQAAGPDAFSRAPIGSGSFIVESWSAARIVYRANPRSWRRPMLERIEILSIPDESARQQALIAGTVDIAMQISPDAKQAIERSGGTLYNTQEDRVWSIALHALRATPTADVRVRRALNYAVNKEAIIAQLLAGGTRVASQPLTPGLLGYDPALEPYAYDPARAKALLAEAGYPEGFSALASVSVGVNANDGAIYQQIAADLAAVGVTVEMRAATAAQITQWFREGSWPGDLFSMDFGTMPSLDPMRAFRMHSCRNAAPWFCDPSLEPLFEAAQTEPDDEKRAAHIRALSRAYHEAAPVIYLWPLPLFDGVAARVKNYAPRHNVVRLETLDLAAR
jgi:peptide/nickel transport system substrate-binding protein